MTLEQILAEAGSSIDAIVADETALAAVVAAQAIEIGKLLEDGTVSLDEIRKIREVLAFETNWLEGFPARAHAVVAVLDAAKAIYSMPPAEPDSASPEPTKKGLLSRFGKHKVQPSSAVKKSAGPSPFEAQTAFAGRSEKIQQLSAVAARALERLDLRRADLEELAFDVKEAAVKATVEIRKDKLGKTRKNAPPVSKNERKLFCLEDLASLLIDHSDTLAVLRRSVANVDFEGTDEMKELAEELELQLDEIMQNEDF